MDKKVDKQNDLLVAIDPGLRSTGVAMFRGGALVRVERSVTSSEDSLPDRTVAAAEDIASKVWCIFGGEKPGHVIVEWPQVYRSVRSKGDPNDLLAIAGVASAILTKLSWIGMVAEAVTPAQWCGQLPKATKGPATESVRAKRILSKLTEAERALVPDQHDAIDAVGIGLFALGRFGKRR